MTDVDLRPAPSQTAAAPPPPAVPPPTAPPDAHPDTAGAQQRSGPRQWLFRALGPALALALYVGLPAHEALGVQARVTAALVVLMAVWWMTEALPLPVTSLVPIVALPLLGVLEIDAATGPYASPTVFLFLGGFVIALAMQRWGLHTRIALYTVRLVGTQPRRLVLGVMIATASLSMWVSNTAATLMMIPIGLSVLGLAAGGRPAADPPASPTLAVADLDRDTRNFAVSIVLAIAYAATIGGVATLIGSPPTLVMAGFVQEAYGISIGFGSWMLLGVPLAAVFLVVAWLLLTRVAFVSHLPSVAGGRRVVDAELERLGPMSAGEWTVLVVFAATAALWIVREPLGAVLPIMTYLSDEAIAIAAAVVLLSVPVRGHGGEPALRWEAAQKGLPWGVLLLFGGGLSLARGVTESGLDTYVGDVVSGLGVLPAVLLIVAVAATVLLLTELTSNTATAATFVPVLGGIAVGTGIEPLVLLVPAALAATCSFMLPVGTPPNAIAFGSGHVTIGQMARAGLWLNLAGVVLITGATLLLGGLAFGIDL